MMVVMFLVIAKDEVLRYDGPIWRIQDCGYGVLRTRSKPISLNTLCSTNQERLGYPLPTMFDEYFQQPSVVSCAPAVIVAPIPADATCTPSSTSVDQDAPSASTSPTTEDTQDPVLHQYVKGQETPNTQFDNDPFANIFNSNPSSEESSSRDVIVSDLHSANQPFERLCKWTKNYPL
uniref:Integrase, catalytic region, zinc finger, CCHC-type, peptidase aspartic, catalytic n=1 Tax=Tanacetum cinerariifolium TaxID=118510 RepID=A0A6L2NAI3_TANCI|nr:hypothetical protein [Tanacetum cinerariifolium]